jgi:Phospholipase_D-nuclease N-terminal
MLAYVYPILSIFWTLLIFTAIATFFWLIIWCLLDDIRRSDHHGGAKVGWAILIIFVPIIGAMIYIGARPATV